MALTYHKLDKIRIDGSFEFSRISNVRVTSDIRQLLEYPAGHPHPLFTANQESKPAIAFTTPEIDIVLANIGSGGAAITNASHLYFKVSTEVGIPSRVTSTHRRYQVAKCLCYWTNIRAPHNGTAEADVVIQAAYDGSNDPIALQTGQTLSGNLAAGTYFGAGPVLINGTQIEAGSIQQIDIASGINLLQIGGDTEEWDRFVGVERTAPTVNITTSEAAAFFTYGLQGTALDGANGVVAYLRKYSNTGSRVANGTAEHVSFQGLNGVARPQESGGDGSGVTNDQIRCDLTAADDTVLPLLQSTAVTVPS